MLVLPVVAGERDGQARGCWGRLTRVQVLLLQLTGGSWPSFLTFQDFGYKRAVVSLQNPQE